LIDNPNAPLPVQPGWTLLEGEVEIDWRIAIHVPEISGKVRLSLRISRSGRKERAPGKENYDKLKNATEEVTGGFKDAYETATKGTRDYGVRLIEAGRTNLNAAFDYATELLSAKSPSDAIKLSTAQLASSSKRCRNNRRN
jgi:hypothetical protein